MAPLHPGHIDALVSRRTFLSGAAVIAGGAAILAACGGSGSNSTTSSMSASRLFDSRTLRPDGTPQRTVWAVSDDDGYLTTTAPDEIVVRAVTDDGSVALDDVVIPAHREGLLVPYYPIELAFTDSAPVEVTFRAGEAEFTSFVDARGTPNDGLTGPGDAMPALATPVFDDPRGVDPVCTRSPEPCPFHTVSLDDALADGRQVVLNISTPAFCSNQIACGPGLEVLIGLAPELSADVAIIHAEVYTAPTARELGPPAAIMGATGLWFEPCLYVVEADGLVARRLDFMWDTVDLRAAVAALA